MTAFYLLSPLLKYCLVMSQCVQFTFGDKGKVYLMDESALPVTEKERKREGKIASYKRMIPNLLYLI